MFVTQAQVTCDACVHVTNDFHIKKPHRALLDLLGADEVEGRSLQLGLRMLEDA